MSQDKKMQENLEKLADESDQSSDESDDAIDDSEAGEVVNVNFEGFSAEDDDFFGIKRLVSQTFRGLQLNLSDVTDVIISQNYVGSVIKQVIDDEREAMEVDKNALDGEPDEEGDFVFGLITVINITKRREDSFCKYLKPSLEKVCSKSKASEEMKSQFLSLLNQTENHVGLLINERLVNLTAELSLPAFSCLQDEVKEANDTGLDFNFKHYVMICKLYTIATLKGKKKAKKNGNSLAAKERIKEVYGKSEDEIFAKYATISIDYSVEDIETLDADSWNNKETFQNAQKKVHEYRRVLVIPADKMEEAVREAIANIE